MKGADEIEGLGRPGDRVRLASGSPSSASSLSPQDAYVLSRIVGEPSLREAIRAVGLPFAQTCDLLRRLREKGLIVIGDAAPAAAQKPPAGEQEVQLSAEQQAEIREVAASLPTVKHWELLKVRRMAAPDEVKEAFFAQSKRFHPDRFWGRELGSYRREVEAIFRQLKEAEATLSDPARRAAYLAANPETRTAAERAQDDVTAQRRAERSERLRRTNPLLQRAQGAAHLASHAKRLLEDGRFAEASATFAAAASKHGRSEELQKAAEVSAARARRDRAARVLESARAAQERGRLAAARAGFLEAAEVGGETAVSIAAIGSFLDCGGDPAAVRTLASALESAEPSNADVHALQGRLLLAAGLEKAGMAAIERALRLDPSQPFANSVKRKARWPF